MGGKLDHCFGNRPHSPCKDCERRLPYPQDCHNSEYCPAWGEYQEVLKEWHRMAKKSTTKKEYRYETGRRLLKRSRRIK